MGFSRDVCDVERTVNAVIVALPQRVALYPLVVVKNILPCPTAITERRPLVEILRLAADIDHGVDRARAAQKLPARTVVDAIGKTGNRLGEVHPIYPTVVEGLAVADRDLDPDSAVRWPRLR